MNIETLVWETVISSEDKDFPKEYKRNFKRSMVFYQSELGTLRIDEILEGVNGAHSYLFSEAKLINLTPWSMQWEAYAWSSDAVSKTNKLGLTGKATVDFKF